MRLSGQWRARSREPGWRRAAGGPGARLDRRGATAIEFALVSLTLCAVTLGIVETGLVLWARTGLVVVAAATARCGAIGLTNSSSTCGTASQTQTYAVTSATTGGTASNGSYIVGWGLPVSIGTSNVTITTSSAGSCGGVTITGTYYQVDLTASITFPLLPVFQDLNSMFVTGCYPLPA